MALTLSVDDVKSQIDEFSKIATGFKIKAEEPESENENYVHILRDCKRIGCFIHRTDGIVFSYHNSHPLGRAKSPNKKAKEILVNKLKTQDIEDIILRTPGDFALC